MTLTSCCRHVLVPVAVLLLLGLHIIGPLVPLAHADAIARTAGIIATAGGAGIARGPGAVCARSEVVGNADPAAGNPAAKGCNDTTRIGPVGGPLEQIIGNASTEVNGNREQGVFPARAGGLAGGRALLFNEADVPDKVAAALAAPDSVLVLSRTAAAVALPRAGFANATQTVTVNPFIARGDRVQSSAAAQVAGGRGISFAIVNDPIDVDLFDPALAGVVAVRIGNGADLLSLEASGPDDFAVALFEFGQGAPGSTIGITVLSFAVDHATQSVADAISVLQFDASSGFPSSAALETYLESPTNDFFGFDAAAHRLTQKKEALLLVVDLRPGASPVRIVFNTEAIAGTVPAPGTLVLLGAGLLVVRWARRSARSRSTSSR